MIVRIKLYIIKTSKRNFLFWELNDDVLLLLISLIFGLFNNGIWDKSCRKDAPPIITVSMFTGGHICDGIIMVLVVNEVNLYAPSSWINRHRNAIGGKNTYLQKTWTGQFTLNTEIVEEDKDVRIYVERAEKIRVYI